MPSIPVARGDVVAVEPRGHDGLAHFLQVLDEGLVHLKEQLLEEFNRQLSAEKASSAQPSHLQPKSFSRASEVSEDGIPSAFLPQTRTPKVGPGSLFKAMQEAVSPAPSGSTGKVLTMESPLQQDDALCQDLPAASGLSHVGMDNGTIKEETNEEAEVVQCTKAIECTNCGTMFTDDAEFCRKCGHERPEVSMKCETCGNVFLDDAHFCRKCGAKRTERRASETQAPQISPGGPGRQMSPGGTEAGPVEQRWLDLFMKLTRPAARYERLYDEPPFQVHQHLAEVSAKLRRNNPAYKNELSRCVVKIMEERKAEGNPSRISASGLVGVRGQSSIRCGSVSSSEAREELLAHRIMFHPSGKVRIAWTVLAVICQILEAILIPLEVFFGDGFERLPKTTFTMLVVLWCSRIFWTFDIALSFVTGKYIDGILEMRPRFVARRYVRTWLIFDLSIVATDWLTWSLTTIHGSLRFLYLLQLLRMLKVHMILGEALLGSPRGQSLYSGRVKHVLAYGLYIHFMSCVWFGVGELGKQDGWHHYLRDAELYEQYFTSSHWAVAQLHGYSNVFPGTALELLCCTATLFVGAHLLAILISDYVVMTGKSNGATWSRARQTCAVFAANHNLSPDLTRVAQKYIDGIHAPGNLSQQLKDETKMLDSFHHNLRADILDATRKHLLTPMLFFRDLSWVTPRTMRMLCTDVVSTVTATKGELFFTSKDPCDALRVLDVGKMTYCLVKEASGGGGGSWDGDAAGSLVMGTMLSMVNRHMSEVKVGDYISEPCLWAKWTYCGDLEAKSDCCLLEISDEQFLEAIIGRLDSSVLAARHAKRYVAELNKPTTLLTDLYRYNFDEDEEPEDDGNADEHLMFLSHYKAEAGTEATLMQEALRSMIDADLKNPAANFVAPVFLDSEDLSDLSTLREHVVKTHNLVLLLTSGVLLRPWCLVEIVTALRNQVQIVPVEIQRPGCRFSYPGEDFYKALRAGESLSPPEVNLLRNEGIELEDLEEAIRHVFTQIAVPFSPHKSKAIREAELRDILARCPCRANINRTPSRRSSSDEHAVIDRLKSMKVQGPSLADDPDSL